VNARLAIATCSTQPALYAEEQELVALFRARGVDAHPAIWDDPGVDWTSFDAVVIRSTWDYFERLDAFVTWLARLERDGVSVWNPPALIRWNADKRYLRDLERGGIRIVPTVFVERGARRELAEILSARRWEEAIVKPSVSAGAFRTRRFRVTEAAAHEAELEAILESCAALVQPYFSEIETEGEWSFLFFGSELALTVLKVPAPGDFRVQTFFGGSFRRMDPSPRLADQARAVMAALPQQPAYARIDGVRRRDDLHLLEVELIEPYLYLTAAEDAPRKYVDAIAALLDA
jgi:glutathione synthase/RimK-type ligase-like ATP-grasp enzyme